MGLLPDKIIRDLQYRRFYSVDASGFSITPDAVYLPSNTDSICNIIQHAIRNNTTITCRGGGTGLTGGSLNSGTILDMKLFNDVTLNDDNVLSAGSGVYKGILDHTLESRSRFFGPNPSVGPYCTVGGMVANNAAGSRSLKYGCTIDNLIKTTIIDGRGDIITLPDDEHYSGAIYDICADADMDMYPCTTKNSSGYRLDAATPENSHKVVAGSEGTLGVIVSADLKTHAKPSSIHLVVISYTDGCDAASDCMNLLKLNPSSLEIIGPGILHDTNTILFVEFDVPLIQWHDKLCNLLCGKILLCSTDAQVWWSRRSSALSRTMSHYRDMPDIIEDVAVPLEEILHLMELLCELEAKSGKKVYYYGHIGDGNIHVRHPANRHLSKWYLDSIMCINGTITAEHGDGIGRTPFVAQQYGDKNYDAFLRLKKLFDPHNIFNPGKIISH